MLSERVHCTVHITTSITLALDDLRSIVASCGDVLGVYAAGALGDSSRYRYYVEFSERRAAKEAGALQVQDMAIAGLDGSPHLVDQFRTLVSSALPPKPHPTVLESARTSSYRKLPKRKTRGVGQTARDKHRSSTYTVLGPPSPMPLSTGSVTFPRPLSLTFDKENHAQLNSWYDPFSTSTVKSDVNPTPLMATYYSPSDSNQSLPSSSSFAELSPSASTSNIPSAFKFSVPRGVSTPRTLPDVDSSLCLTYGGDLFSINLDDLDDSPEEVIAALKAAASHSIECVKWMIVGVHYRRRGNLEAAIAVITMMIEVMLNVGMEVSQLKPAMLMLASCHLDVARCLRAHSGVETTESKFHINQACEGFRKVYGTYEIPSLSQVEDSRSECPTVGTSTLARPRAVSSWNAVQISPIEPPSTPKPAAHTTRTPNASPPSSPRHGQLRILEREVQSLRDRQQKHADQLERARFAKHKLEDELDREQHRRRRVEGLLEKVEKTISGAQRNEEYALEQCRVEIETRRRAEERVHELQEQVAALEPKMAECEERERKTREYFGKMGVAFLKAARGDMGDGPAASMRAS